jgi:hypothetical protein
MKTMRKTKIKKKRTMRKEVAIDTMRDRSNEVTMTHLMTPLHQDTFGPGKRMTKK